MSDLLSVKLFVERNGEVEYIFRFETQKTLSSLQKDIKARGANIYYRNVFYKALGEVFRGRGEWSSTVFDALVPEVTRTAALFSSLPRVSSLHSLAEEMNELLSQVAPVSSGVSPLLMFPHTHGIWGRGLFHGRLETGVEAKSVVCPVAPETTVRTSAGTTSRGRSSLVSAFNSPGAIPVTALIHRGLRGAFHTDQRRVLAVSRRDAHKSADPTASYLDNGPDLPDHAQTGEECPPEVVPALVRTVVSGATGQTNPLSSLF
ncbi:hypothetical protein WMY93_033579 [Mugilogobius chulae]|uniref:Uncharacterized protein n=1 Tax=Mugilogobius chulae TaxID=88201 RepID=A0AAW0MTC2_9GOBI